MILQHATSLSKHVLIRDEPLRLLAGFSSALQLLDPSPQAQIRVPAPSSNHLLCRQVEPVPGAAQHIPALLLSLHPLWPAHCPLPLTIDLAPIAHGSRLASLYKWVTQKSN